MFVQKPKFSISRIPTAFQAETFRQLETNRFEVEAFWVEKKKDLITLKQGTLFIQLKNKPTLPFTYSQLFTTADYMPFRISSYGWSGNKGFINPEHDLPKYRRSIDDAPELEFLKTAYQQLPEQTAGIILLLGTKYEMMNIWTHCM